MNERDALQGSGGEQRTAAATGGSSSLREEEEAQKQRSYRAQRPLISRSWNAVAAWFWRGAPLSVVRGCCAFAKADLIETQSSGAEAKSPGTTFADRRGRLGTGLDQSDKQRPWQQVTAEAAPPVATAESSSPAAQAKLLPRRARGLYAPPKTKRAPRSSAGIRSWSDGITGRQTKTLLLLLRPPTLGEVLRERQRQGGAANSPTRDLTGPPTGGGPTRGGEEAGKPAEDRRETEEAFEQMGEACTGGNQMHLWKGGRFWRGARRCGPPEPPDVDDARTVQGPARGGSKEAHDPRPANPQGDRSKEAYIAPGGSVPAAVRRSVGTPGWHAHPTLLLLQFSLSPIPTSPERTRHWGPPQPVNRPLSAATTRNQPASGGCASRTAQRGDTLKSEKGRLSPP